MKTFNNDPALKAAMLKEIQWHREQDRIVKGTYGEGSNGDFRGCAVGCSIHSLNRIHKIKLATDDHDLYEEYLGIPSGLAHLEDAIFEALPLERAVLWPEQFIEAIPVGADLEMTANHFMYWLLSDENDGVIRYAGKFADVRTAIEQVSGLIMHVIGGLPVTDEQWSAARSAAWSAAWSAARSAAWSAAESAAWSAAESAAWSAAESAARSAAESAARSAAESAAWSAARSAAESAARSAAESAAWSAAESAAWSAARSAAREKQADKLLQLLSEAPIASEISL